VLQIESLAWLGLAIAGLELYYCKIPVNVPDFTNQQPQDIAVDALGGFVYIVYYYSKYNYYRERRFRGTIQEPIMTK
jgi:hypothetical protein